MDYEQKTYMQHTIFGWWYWNSTYLELFGSMWSFIFGADWVFFNGPTRSARCDHFTLVWWSGACMDWLVLSIFLVLRKSWVRVSSSLHFCLAHCGSFCCPWPPQRWQSWFIYMAILCYISKPCLTGDVEVIRVSCHITRVWDFAWFCSLWTW